MTRRAYFWPILVIGVILIVAPFAISLPSKASAGQTMLNNFHPIMQPANVQETVKFFGAFQDLRPVATGGIAAASEIPQLVSGLSKALHMSPAQVEQFLGTQYPAFGGLLSSFPTLVPVFQNVGPGLNDFKPLVATMQNNVHNYAQVDSLPNFNLFTWFFEVPGVLLLIFSLLGLGVFTRRQQGQAAP
jgi:hypothetical protein